MRKAVSLFLLVVFFYSCKKEDVPINKTLTIKELCRLEIGNWWIYGAALMDSTGEYCVGQVGTGIDTIKIIGDTIIRGETYFIRHGTIHGGTVPIHDYLRDSSNCLVNSAGQILVRSDYFNLPFRKDTVIGVYTAQYYTDGNINYVGTFQGTLPCYIMYIEYNFAQYGRRKWDYKYCPGYGLAKWEEYLPDMPNTIEQRMFNCHLGN